MTEGPSGSVQPPNPPGQQQPGQQQGGRHSSGPGVPGDPAPEGANQGHVGAKKPGMIKKLFSRWQVR
jgi:hypothetical protein